MRVHACVCVRERERPKGGEEGRRIEGSKERANPEGIREQPPKRLGIAPRTGGCEGA